MASHVDDNKTRELSEQGKKNWDLIFGKKEVKDKPSESKPDCCPAHWTLGSEQYFKDKAKED